MRRRFLNAVGRRNAHDLRNAAGSAEFTWSDIDWDAAFLGDDLTLSGSTITGWDDSTGNGIDMETINGSPQMLVDSTLNNLQVATFDGTDDWMTRTTSGVTTGGSQPFDIVFVARFDAALRQMVSCFNGAGQTYLRVDATGRYSMVSALPTTEFNAGVVRTSVWRYGMARYNGASSAYYLGDLTTPAATGTMLTINTLNDNLNIGANSGGAGLHIGRIYGLWFKAGTQLTAGELSNMDTWITDTTGL